MLAWSRAERALRDGRRRPGYKGRVRYGAGGGKMLAAMPIEWTSPTTWIVVAVAVLVALFLINLFKPQRSNLLRDDFYARLRERNQPRPRGTT